MRRIPFNGGWETRPHASFFLEMVGAAAPWQPVTLPHDAALGRDRDPPRTAPPPATSPAASYEYRTTLHAPEEYRDQRVLLEFEGVYRSAMVYVNGALAGHWATGYTGFAVDLDDHLLFGADNEIRVVCRAHEDSRWYSGAGIHRPVHLVVGRAHAHRPGRRPRHDHRRRRRVRRRRGRDDGRARRPRAGARSTSSPRSGTATAPSSPPRRRR